jgi:hypothetical protein
MENAFSEKIGQDWLKNLLKESVVTVVFTKVDGSEREMKATLKEDLLPVVEKTDTTKPERKKSDEVLAVFDTEAEGWRSFRWDSIVSIRFDI